MLARAALLALPLLAHAHVAMSYTSNTPGSIRNANGPTSDGGASVNGACGTNRAWGSNGNGEMFDGDTVTLTINYAAGHVSPANHFRMAYACGAPSANTMAGAAAVLESTTHSCTAKADGVAAPYIDNGVDGGVNAASGIADNGYEVTCILPSMNVVEGQPKQCTIALVDQRNWGGCSDVQVNALPEIFPPSPPPAPIVNNQGTYELLIEDAIDSSAESFSCCPMQGTVDVPDYPSGSRNMAARIDISASNCRETVDRDAPTDATYSTDEIVDMVLAFGSRYEGQTEIAGQPFQVVIAGGTVSLSNIGSEDPIVCDMSSSRSELSLSGGDSSGNNAGVVAGAVLGTLAGIALLGAGYWYCCKRKKDPSASYNTEMARPPGAGLPAGWTSAQDPKSGVTYYVCQATGQSTWTQPTVNYA